MKNLNTNESKANDVSKKTLISNDMKQKFKISTLSSMITALICVALPTHASDIEIYKVPEDSVGSTTLLLMLDTSGSMKWGMNNTSDQSDEAKSRLGILKQGLRDVLSGTPTIPRVADKIVMGLADFSGNNGRILALAKPLGELTGGK